MPRWDPDLYLKFSGERTKPALDLAEGIPLASAADAVDVGCGPGNSTEVLAARFPEARLLGVDSSPAMIEQASRRCPGAEFALCDARELPSLGRQFDVVYSNACLQWIPGHRELIPTLFSCVREGGALAVQMPMNDDEPLYRIIAETVRDPKWGVEAAGDGTFSVLTPDGYVELLCGLADDFSVWQTVYYHRLGSHEELVEWATGTRLRPYLEALTPERGGAMLAEILEKARRAYPVYPDGRVLLKFNRLFFVAIKPA